MKKIILTVGLLFTAAFTQAQDITVYNGEQQITEGYVFIATSTDVENPDDLHLLVTNVSDSNIRLMLKITNLENADNIGNHVQFCFGDNCYYTIEEGSTVGPVNGNGTQGLLLEPGLSNNENDHFFSVYPGDNPALNVVYDLAFIEVAPNGDQIGDPLINFTYRYEPTAGVNDFETLKNMGITIKNTVVKDMLELEASQNAEMKLYDITGKMLKDATVTEGTQAIDLSGLSAAVYIAKFTTTEDKTSQIRIVKN